MSPKLLRRTITPNQIVAYNVAQARQLRGWTQEQAAEALEPYLGTRWSNASFSAVERSAWTINRIKQFSADDLLALSRGFDLPIGYFLTPPPPELDAGLATPDAPLRGLDPLVLLDAVLGTVDNTDEWRHALDAYTASTAPPPSSGRGKPNVAPRDLAARADILTHEQARAAIRRTFGDVSEARAVLARLGDLLDTLDNPIVTERKKR